MATHFRSYTIIHAGPTPAFSLPPTFVIPLVPMLDRVDDFPLWERELVRLLRQLRLIAAIRVDADPDNPRFYPGGRPHHQGVSLDGDGDGTAMAIIRYSLSPAIMDWLAATWCDCAGLEDPKVLYDHLVAQLARPSVTTRLQVGAIRLRRSLWALDSPVLDWFFYSRRVAAPHVVHLVPRIMG